MTNDLYNKMGIDTDKYMSEYMDIALNTHDKQLSKYAYDAVNNLLKFNQAVNLGKPMHMLDTYAEKYLNAKALMQYHICKRFTCETYSFIQDEID